ncbi:EAL domain-containing protein [Rossellomorea aquimaris]|uniref:EAL domain-containing protein n=1 Tax=Rossellomorea aquimaris TaxID=189382 RepID=UPI0007D08E55|nr:EAL domain-containing protein [Rossellomorea aquimaris]
MNFACANCGITMNFYESGNVILHNNKVLPSPIERAKKINDYTFVFPYNSQEALQETLSMNIEMLEKQEWKCSLSLTEIPGEFSPVSEFINRIKKRELVEIIQNGQFKSHLQPIINLKDFRLYGYESLLRSSNPDNQINPATLFETASVTGFHSMLDQKARQSAIESRKGQIQTGIKSFINFLPSTIYNPEFCLRHTFNIVNKYGVNPNDLVFEVVETEKIEDINHLKSVLEVYQREGMKVALDDVGSGFSTIEMLTLLQPDYVKIDRSYINHCDSNEENQQFLERVLKISKELGIYVLAEGIEREEELTYCKNIGVDFAQGYYIGKPSQMAEKPLLHTLLV